MNLNDYLDHKEKLAIVGLGYVGLPLALFFSKKFKVLGFDIDEKRVDELDRSEDRNHDVELEELKKSNIEFTSDCKSLASAKTIIVTVPTPIDQHKTPDLKPIFNATKLIAENIQKGTTIVYESTVYPGLTEEECVPLIEEISGLKWKRDFNVGYSPERVNPGDKNHTIDKIVKVVAGDSGPCSNFLKELYGQIITAGIHLAPNIKTAEAAKVIENTQRDINIALVNELSIIFNKIGINSSEVLAAAGTKWNFLKFYPGLVGGHCIGVDPYYLTHKARHHGIEPEVILAGRRTNDYMGKYVAEQTIKKLIEAGKRIKDSKVLILGFTFKENISDFRNTKVEDICNELATYHIEPIVHDPHIDKEKFSKSYKYTYSDDPLADGPYSAIIFAVNHEKLLEEFTFTKCRELQEGSPVLIDVKGSFQKNNIPNGDVHYFKL